MLKWELLSNILIDTIVQLLLHKITNRIPDHKRIDNTLAGGRAPRWRLQASSAGWQWGTSGSADWIHQVCQRSNSACCDYLKSLSSTGDPLSHVCHICLRDALSHTLAFIHSQLANRPGYGTALRMEQWVPQPGRGLHLNRKKPKVQFEKPSKESIVKLSPTVSMWMAIFSRPQLDTRHATAHKWSTVITVRYSKVLYSHWVT